jgi:hypothetical protein
MIAANSTTQPMNFLTEDSMTSSRHHQMSESENLIWS